MFKSILIANRGEIACRIIRTARILGIKSVAVYSEADKNALHVDMASDSILIGPASPAESYLNIDAVMEAIELSGADAVHPGYGFLSENADFVERLEHDGITFIGPRPDAIRQMGDKIESRKIAIKTGIPTVPGIEEPIQEFKMANKIANEIGYPIMLKASAGGGGRGIRVVPDKSQLKDALKTCILEAESSFGDGRIFIEKFIVNPRHIEIQILADMFGNIVHLGERECSIQRRHQKVMEEAPSPFLSDQMRKDMGAQAVTLAAAVDYSSAGTVEFIVDADRNFYFIEMNTRLQVEHPVTELVTGIDLVEQMIKIAAGQKLEFSQSDIKLNGWSMESRIYAEDPARGFLPSIGRLVRYREPITSVFGTTKNVRVDGGVNEGDDINRYYDPMISKLITNGKTRGEAIKHMRWALDEYYIRGVANNLGFLAAVTSNSRFQAGNLSTNFIVEEFGKRFIPEKTKHEDVELIVVVVGAVNCIVAEKKSCLLLRRMDGTSCYRDNYQVRQKWVVIFGEKKYPIRVIRSNNGFDISVGKRSFVVETDWTPGNPLFSGRLNGELVSMQIEKEATFYKVQHTGLTTDVRVISPIAADMLSMIPEKLAPDYSKQVLSPMPGLLMSIDVEEGQEVTLGEPLATVEAMKMENKIVAERNGVITKIHLSAGDNLEVGQLIMELK